MNKTYNVIAYFLFMLTS